MKTPDPYFYGWKLFCMMETGNFIHLNKLYGSPRLGRFLIEIVSKKMMFKKCVIVSFSYHPPVSPMANHIQPLRGLAFNKSSYAHIYIIYGFNSWQVKFNYFLVCSSRLIPFQLPPHLWGG